MSHALQGELSKDMLPNLLQYLAQNVADGCLVLRHPDSSQGYIFFSKGELVHASLGVPSHGKTTQKDITALAVLITWAKGRFQFREAVPAPVETLQLPLSNVLMQAAQMADEESRVTGELLHERSVLRARVTDRDDIHLLVSLEGLKLLSYLDGVNSLAEIAEARRLNLRELISTAQTLFLEDLIEHGAALLEPELIPELKQLLISLVGPMGQIIVEDALLELNLSEDAVPKRALGELLDLLRLELRKPDWRTEFERKLTQLAQRYEVSV